MYYGEDPTEIIGARCTLLEPYNGYEDGQVVGDYGIEVVVRLTNGNEIVAYRDEIVIYD